MKIDFSKIFSKKQPIDPSIKARLEKLGLKPTGSYEGDIDLIKDKISKMLSEEINSQEPGIFGAPQAPPLPPLPPPPKTPVEVSNFMKKLGLNPTNSKEGDAKAVSEKISQLEKLAKTDKDKQKVKDLAEEFITITSNIKPPHKPPAGDSFSMNNFIGMEQIGALNKLFLIG